MELKKKSAHLHTYTRIHTNIPIPPVDLQSFPHLDPIPDNSRHRTPAEEMPKSSEVEQNSLAVHIHSEELEWAGRAAEPLIAGSCMNNSGARMSRPSVPPACRALAGDALSHTASTFARLR